jgi:hypothetical protein
VAVAGTYSVEGVLVVYVSVYLVLGSVGRCGELNNSWDGAECLPRLTLILVLVLL